MKVVAFNGSPRKEGNTYHALKIVGDELDKNGIEFEIVHVGNQVIRGCIACGGCFRNRDEKCVLKDDSVVNEGVQKIKEADGVLLGSPVYFASISGTMKSFLDRVFYVQGANGGMFRHKVGASVVSVRRSGGSATFDHLNHYINYAQMFMPGSNYWNIAHGTMPGEIHKDDEGVQIMRVLGKNMALTIKMVEASKDDLKALEDERKIITNFVR